MSIIIIIVIVEELNSWTMHIFILFSLARNSNWIISIVNHQLFELGKFISKLLLLWIHQQWTIIMLLIWVKCIVINISSSKNLKKYHFILYTKLLSNFIDSLFASYSIVCQNPYFTFMQWLLKLHHISRCA